MYLYGAGGHSKVVLNILENNGVHVKGLFDDDKSKNLLKDVKVFSGIREEDPKEFSLLDEPLIICVGDNLLRAELAQKLNVTFGKAIHNSSIIAADVPVGEGTVVLHGAIIQTGSKIGKHVLINTAASVDHDNIINDYAHISPRATLCGHVTVGEGTHIGAGAIVIPKIKIGKWCIIGAGAVVIRDIPDFSIAVGNPAKILSDKSKTYKYHCLQTLKWNLKNSFIP